MQSAIEAIIALDLGITEEQADKIFNAVISAFPKALTADPDLRLRGLGRFQVKVRKGRTYRNPKTGEPIEKPDTQVVKFTPSQALKDAALSAEL